MTDYPEAVREARTYCFDLDNPSESHDELCRLFDAAVAALQQETTRWIWVAHMVWSVPDPSPYDARSYPIRLAEQWHSGLSYHDGRFHDGD